MLAVGIDVSKSKSTAAILNQDGSILAKPFNFKHNNPDMDAFIKYLREQNEPVKILMEYTGHYHCVFRLNGTACTLQREGCPLQTGSFFKLHWVTHVLAM